MQSVTIPTGPTSVTADLPPPDAALPHLLVSNNGRPAWLAFGRHLYRDAPDALLLATRASVVIRGAGQATLATVRGAGPGSVTLTRIAAGAFGRFPVVDAP